METCYYCEEPLNVVFNPEGGGVEDVGGDVYFCTDCQRWQCNTEECGCVCELSDDDLYSQITGDMSTSEVVEMGLESLKNEITGIWHEVDMGGFQVKYMPYLITDAEKIDKLTSAIYEYARRNDR